MRKEEDDTFCRCRKRAADLITVRGKAFLEEADVLIYAGSGKSAVIGLCKRGL